MGIEYSVVKIFISTSHREPDISLAKEFAQKLEDLGYEVFLAKNNILIGEEWKIRLKKELNSCNYLLLLLSENSVTSDMVYWEVKEIQERKNEPSPPIILPIRVNLPYHVNYDLSKQLEKIHQLDWKSEDDTILITEKISSCISKNSSFGDSKKRVVLTYTDRPIPNAPLILEQPSGTVALDSRYYIERKDDKRCYQNLSTKYALIRIKAPRQYGKTSLLARLILEAKEREHHIVSLNFQRFDNSLLNNLERLLEVICKILSHKLRIKVDDEILLEFTSKVRATIYMEEILSSIDKPLVLTIDEADILFENKDVSNEFFGLIRAWHEESKTDSLWEKLKIILSHSTDPLLGVDNIHQSPFYNVGLGVELKPFTKKEIIELASRHGIELKDDLDRLIKLIGGHPYLCRLVLYTMVIEKQSFDDILKNAYGQESIFWDHIKRYIWRINGDERLKNSIKELLKGNTCSDDYSCYILEATGLIKNILVKPEFSCELYKNFFSKLII